ncbi:MAG: FMN-dependent NADH-azoreductase [Phycisphaerae bacterium]
MTKVLFIQSSPRGQRSRSIQVAKSFLEGLAEARGQLETDTLDLFQADLPPFDGAALEAKYEILSGSSPSDAHRQAWAKVEAVIDRFTSADVVVLAVPMWNFGIPYVLKHFFDVIVQPGYTFSYDPEKGYSGLVTGKTALVAYARGGDYDAEALQAVDHQQRYLELILGFVGFGDVRSVTVQPTLMGDEDSKSRKLAGAVAEARKIGSQL